jgi:hypothetical protein
MTRAWKTGLFGALAFAALAFATPASAGSRPNLCDPPKKDCVLECRHDYTECRQDVRELAKESLAQCLELNCKDVIAEARKVCAAGRSEACKAARANAETCLARCKTVVNDEIEAASARCREAAAACAEDCKTTTP